MKKDVKVIRFTNTEFAVLSKAIWVVSYYSSMHFLSEEAEVLKSLKSRFEKIE